MKKKTVKKKAAKKVIKKPSYETLERKIRKFQKLSKQGKSTWSNKADLYSKAYDLFKDVHGSNGNIVSVVNNIVQESVDQLWSQVRMKVINYGGPL